MPRFRKFASVGFAAALALGGVAGCGDDEDDGVVEEDDELIEDDDAADEGGIIDEDE